MGSLAAADPSFRVQKQASNIKYSKYKTKNGDTIANILRRLKLKPLWGSRGYVKKTININKENKYLDGLNRIKADIIIELPIQNQDPSYQYDSNEWIVLPKLQPREIANENLVVDTEKLETLNFKYSCSNLNNPEVYSHVSNFILENSSLIKELNVDFTCGDYQPYEVLAWLKTNKDNDRKKNNYLFISIGQGDIDYEEGSFDTKFSHRFLNLHYRSLIGKSDWLFDIEGQYTLNNDPEELEQADPKILDIDVRFGKTLSALQEPWSFSLYAGVFYTQMFVEDDLYGYKGTYYPQIYPEFRRTFKDGDAVTFFFKYIPTANDFASFESDLRSLESGFVYYMRGWKTPVHFNLHYIDFRFFSEDGNKNVKIKQTNFSIGIGF